MRSTRRVHISKCSVRPVCDVRFVACPRYFADILFLQLKWLFKNNDKKGKKRLYTIVNQHSVFIVHNIYILYTLKKDTPLFLS